MDWWDGDRWDRELAADLLKVAHTIAAVLGPRRLKSWVTSRTRTTPA